MNRAALPFTLSMLLFSVTVTNSAHAVSLSTVSHFQDGTNQGWNNGPASPPLVALADAGPNGLGDYALEMTSDGASSGGRLVAFNSTQWGGDYTTAGIDKIYMHLKNLTSSTLTMRLAIEGAGGRFASSGVSVPASNSWTAVSFDVLAPNWTAVDGGSNINTTLATASVLRILHNPSPAWRGMQIAGDLLVDNIRTTIPEPSSMTMGLLFGASVCLRRVARSRKCWEGPLDE